jgi:hypothetical protein
MVARKTFRGVALYNGSGNYWSHDKFICPISRRRHGRAACCGHDIAPLASLEDAVGTIRRRAPRRMWRDIHRIQPAKGQPRPDCDRVDSRHGIHCAALAGLWVTPWIVPVAWAAHGIWDYAHHQSSRLASIPSRLVAIPLWWPILRLRRLGGGGVLGGYVGPACLNDHA